MTYPIIWGLLFLAGLVVEGLALRDSRKGDTLSEQVWLLRTRALGRLVLMPAWAWLTWHFWLEPASLGVQRGVWSDDILIVVIAALVGLFVNYKDADVDFDLAWDEDEYL